MGKTQHTHKFYKSNTGWGKNKKIVYRCALPDCSTYLIPEAVLNKLSICWRCGNEFILPKALSLLMSKPWCPDCSETRKIKVRQPEPIVIGTDETVRGDNLDDFIKNLIGDKQ